MLKYVNLKIRMQKLLMGPWDPGLRVEPTVGRCRVGEVGTGNV